MTRDLLAITGLAMLTAGCYCAWPPLAGIMPGVLLLTAAISAHFAQRRPRK